MRISDWSSDVCSSDLEGDHMTGALTPASLSPDWSKSPAAVAADILLEIQAVHIRPEQPFTFTSGRLSPVYVDCRRIIAFPRARRRLQLGRASGRDSVCPYV